MIDNLTTTGCLSCGSEEISYIEAIPVQIENDVSTSNSKTVKKVQYVTTTKTEGSISVRVAMLDKVTPNNSTI